MEEDVAYCKVLASTNVMEKKYTGKHLFKATSKLGSNVGAVKQWCEVTGEQSLKSRIL
jgi:hypothetical protein